MWLLEEGLSCIDCFVFFVIFIVLGSIVIYLLEVEDGLGVIGSVFVMVQVDEMLLIDVGSIVVIDVICFNNNDGVIDLVFFGGFGVIFWWMGFNGYIFLSQSFINFMEGIYIVVVINLNGCEEEEFFIVNSFGVGVEVIGDVIGFICDGDDFVILDIIVMGGLFGYIYFWSDG